MQDCLVERAVETVGSGELDGGGTGVCGCGECGVSLLWAGGKPNEDVGKEVEVRRAWGADGGWRGGEGAPRLGVYGVPQGETAIFDTFVILIVATMLHRV